VTLQQHEVAFWQAVYVEVIRSGGKLYDAVFKADAAVEALRVRTP
jgi:hypothetical protein